MTRFNHIGPTLAVRDVPAGIAFFAKVLDFGIDYLGGDPPEYAVVFRDEVYIHLSVPDEPVFPAGSGRVLIVVSEIEPVWEKVVSVYPESVIDSLADCDWGLEVRFKAFTMVDLDGNTLRIAEPLDVEEQEG